MSLTMILTSITGNGQPRAANPTAFEPGQFGCHRVPPCLG
jgi:hypothetical protein